MGGHSPLAVLALVASTLTVGQPVGEDYDAVSLFQQTQSNLGKQGAMRVPHLGDAQPVPEEPESVRKMMVQKATDEMRREASASQGAGASQESESQHRPEPGALALALAESAIKKVATTSFDMLLVGLPTLVAALPQAAAASSEAACTARDQQEMKSTFSVLYEAVDAAELPARFALIKENCTAEQLLSGGLDYTRASDCLGHVLNVSDECSKCHGESFKAFLGKDFYDLGCVPGCMRAQEHCQVHLHSEACYKAVAGCMDCAKPALDKMLACHGGSGRAKALQSFEDCVERTREGRAWVQFQARHVVDYLNECFFDGVPPPRRGIALADVKEM
uniref:Uncharacterized protein n=1 Tax=Alexandrium catenella TaxID=2925 RepID=A0A7S1WB34_ALECA|mmetsp:Transcript_46213/g.124089  ORF Transcript_46213/g.124089 Transcript_46213/m.124089 type:complete len:334 (+) Transcript_46213:43-1044(+)